MLLWTLLNSHNGPEMLSKYKPQTPANTASKHKLYCKHSHSSLGLLFVPSMLLLTHILHLLLTPSTLYLLLFISCLNLSHSGYRKNFCCCCRRLPLCVVPLLCLGLHPSLLTAAVVVICRPLSRALEVSLRSSLRFCFSTHTPFTSFAEIFTKASLFCSIYLYQIWSHVQNTVKNIWFPYESDFQWAVIFFYCCNLIWKKREALKKNIPDRTH